MQRPIMQPIMGDHEDSARSDLSQVAEAIRVISGKWRLPIIVALHAGPQRFERLRRHLDGVSQKVLTEALRALQAAGIVTRTEVARWPAHVEYSLSECGVDLLRAIEPLALWATPRPPVRSCGHGPAYRRGRDRAEEQSWHRRA